MTPADLARVGAALYGERWRFPLARDLGISARTMCNVAAGNFGKPYYAAPPEKYRAQLVALAEARVIELADIAKKLRDGEELSCNTARSIVG